jgi:hypothetical protein
MSMLEIGYPSQRWQLESKSIPRTMLENEINTGCTEPMFGIDIPLQQVSMNGAQAPCKRSIGP